jgi:hypothetical protein
MRIRLARHVARMEEKKEAYGILVEKQRERAARKTMT